jgi:cytochrome c peroxidase
MLRHAKQFFMLLLLFMAANVNASQALRTKAQQHFKPIPAQLPASAADPLIQVKAALGKMLFFEPRLSASGLLSCNTCHNLGMGGDDNLPTSVGHHWQRGPRNTPTVLNAVLNQTLCWDGRMADIKTQTKNVLHNNIIMNNSPQRVLAALNSMPQYVRLFNEAFADQAEPVSLDNMASAIEAFEGTLLTPGAPFDRWLQGDDSALNAQQLAGLELFIDEGCVECHAGVNLGGEDYYSFGLVERPGATLLPPEDRGRFTLTKTASDEYVFRAPPLRNVALTAPYFHSGQVWSLQHAVAVMGAFQVGTELSEADEAAITAFLDSLTGQQPQLTYPLLPPSTAQTPQPIL